MPLKDRKDIFITEIETKHFEDLSVWYSEIVDKRYKEEMVSWARQMKRTLPEEFAADTGPTEAGWVIQIRGYHYYNSPEKMGFEGSNHVRRTLTTNLIEKPIELAVQTEGDQVVMQTFTPQEFGFSYPLQLDERQPDPVAVPNPDYDPNSLAARLVPASGLRPGQKLIGPDGEELQYDPPSLQELRLDFVFQVVWKPVTLQKRLDAKKAAEEAAATEEEAAAAANGGEVAMN
jgi:type IV pilus assembly protein PilM